LAGATERIVFGVVALALVAVPTCGQFTGRCPDSRFDWRMFSGGGFADESAHLYADGELLEADGLRQWLETNARYSTRALEDACERTGASEVTRRHRGEVIDRLDCP
jgi:hypothetical protein